MRSTKTIVIDVVTCDRCTVEIAPPIDGCTVSVLDRVFDLCPSCRSAFMQTVDGFMSEGECPNSPDAPLPEPAPVQEEVEEPVQESEAEEAPESEDTPEDVADPEKEVEMPEVILPPWSKKEEPSAPVPPVQSVFPDFPMSSAPAPSRKLSDIMVEILTLRGPMIKEDIRRIVESEYGAVCNAPEMSSVATGLSKLVKAGTLCTRSVKGGRKAYGIKEAA